MTDQSLDALREEARARIDDLMFNMGHRDDNARMDERNRGADLIRRLLAALPREQAGCHVCGEKTDHACSDCRINFGATVYVCRKISCRDAHDEKCFSAAPHAVPEDRAAGKCFECLVDVGLVELLERHIESCNFVEENENRMFPDASIDKAREDRAFYRRLLAALSPRPAKVEADNGVT